jgi:signal transduction histidine kinase
MWWQGLIGLVGGLTIIFSLVFLNKTESEIALEETKKLARLALEENKDNLALFKRFEMDQAKTDLASELNRTFKISEIIVSETEIPMDRYWIDSKVLMGDQKYFIYAKVEPDPLVSVLHLSALQLIVFISLSFIMLALIGFSYFFVYLRIFRPLTLLRRNLESLKSSREFNSASIPAIGEIKEVLMEVQRIYDQSLETESQRIEKELSQRLAHDLRSPLAALKVLFQDLHDYGNRELLQKTMDRISNLAHKLTKLNEKSPEESKSDDFDLGSLCQHLIEEKKLQYSEQKGLTIRMRLDDSSKPLMIEGDSFQMARALSNLLDNAIEASLESSRALKTITVSLETQKPGRVLLSIKDFGVGIPVAVLSQLGQSQITTKANGTGLGLLQSAETLVRLGGRLEINSEVDKFTEVKIVLPLSESRSESSKFQGESASHAQFG